MQRLLYPGNPDRSEGPPPLVNGVVYPRMTVGCRQIRLRVLNGANARVFRLSADAPLTVICNDGGLLEAAAAIDVIQMGPAGRADLIPDLRGHRPGDVVTLSDPDFAEPQRLIDLEDGPTDGWEIPQHLSPIAPLQHKLAEPDRNFTFEGQQTINGLRFGPRRLGVHEDDGMARFHFGLPGRIHRDRRQQLRGPVDADPDAARSSAAKTCMSCCDRRPLPSSSSAAKISAPSRSDGMTRNSAATPWGPSVRLTCCSVE
ncbi:cupredoxin domain-containing protein [Mangrovicoccus algicola]|uniref:Plastocyanin-like domain-containing protein n=1 Tax=Mangrovicoccus algicola TaxID=2771008 RepID=A0A8J6YVY2_9RHOB|nr:hypothetical protein [Mangrovicoccus algicola]MBE3637204.1 hypothetical protein [Mangrovicoccus algicola]